MFMIADTGCLTAALLFYKITLEIPAEIWYNSSDSAGDLPLQ